MKLVLILGCYLIKDKNGILIPGPILQGRLEKSLEVIKFIEENEKIQPMVIVSGSSSKGPINGCTEAKVMKKWLIDNGVNEYYIFEENYSRNTIENCAFSKLLLDEITKFIEKYGYIQMMNYDESYERYYFEKVDEIIVVTSDFHIRRSVRLAEAAFNDYKIKYIGSETPDDHQVWIEKEKKINIDMSVKCLKTKNWGMLWKHRMETDNI